MAKSFPLARVLETVKLLGQQITSAMLSLEGIAHLHGSNDGGDEYQSSPFMIAEHYSTKESAQVVKAVDTVLKDVENLYGSVAFNVDQTVG